jgi:hypothetical protein
MGLIKLKNPSLWTLGTGLEYNGDAIGLSRFEDNFADKVLDTAKIGALTANLGYVTPGGALNMRSPNDTDAAGFYIKSALVINEADVHSMQMYLAAVGGISYPLIVAQPITGAPAVDNLNTGILITQQSAGLWRIEYRDAVGTFYRWNQSTGAWQLGSINIPTPIDYSHQYEFRLIKTTTSWAVRITDLTAATVIADTSPQYILWSNINDNGNSYYKIHGDPFTVFARWIGTCSLVYTNYPLTSQLATMGAVDVYAAFEQFPVSQVGDVVWEYNKDNAGWVLPGAGAPADIQAALSGLYMETIDFRATLNSDAEGDADASFDINGGALAGPVRLARFGVRQ